MNKRVDFTTTEERSAWLKATAARQEISVSQLINRLIRNRMKNEEKFVKKTSQDKEPCSYEEARILSKAEILARIEEAHPINELEDEDELPF